MPPRRIVDDEIEVIEIIDDDSSISDGGHDETNGNHHHHHHQQQPVKHEVFELQQLQTANSHDVTNLLSVPAALAKKTVFPPGCPVQVRLITLDKSNTTNNKKGETLRSGHVQQVFINLASPLREDIVQVEVTETRHPTKALVCVSQHDVRFAPDCPVYVRLPATTSTTMSCRHDAQPSLVPPDDNNNHNHNNPHKGDHAIVLGSHYLPANPAIGFLQEQLLYSIQILPSSSSTHTTTNNNSSKVFHGILPHHLSYRY